MAILRQSNLFQAVSSPWKGSYGERFQDVAQGADAPVSRAMKDENQITKNPAQSYASFCGLAKLCRMPILAFVSNAGVS